MPLDPDQLGSPPRPRLSRPVVSAAMIAALLAAAWWLQAAFALPQRLADVAAGPDVLTIRLTILAGFVWSGLASGMLASILIRRPVLTVALPLWAAGLAASIVAASAGVVMLALPGAWSWDLARRVVALSFEPSMALLLMTVAALMAAAMPWRRAWPQILLVLTVGAPWFVLSRLVLGGTLRDTLFSWQRIGGMPSDALLLIVVLLVAIAAVLVALATLRLGAGLFAAALVALAVAVCDGWFLVHLAFEPRSTGGGVPYGAIQELLLPASDAEPAGGETFILWCRLLGTVTVTLAAGLGAAMLITGRRRSDAVAGTQHAADTPDSSDLHAAPSADRWFAWRAEITYSVIAVACFVLGTYISIVPLDYRAMPFQQAVDRFMRTPYLPLTLRNRQDLVANMVFLFVMTFATCGAFTKAGRRSGQWVLAAFVVLLAAHYSVALEFVQQFFHPRTVSQNDIIIETAGAAVGAAAWLLVGKRVSAWGGALRRSASRRARASTLLAGYAVALVAAQLFPFDFAASLEELRTGSRLVLSLVPGSQSLLMIAIKTVIYVPVGYWAVVRVHGNSRPIRSALLWSLALATVVEVIQIPIYTHTARLSDIGLAGFGGLLGALAAIVLGPAARYPVLPTSRWQRWGWALHAVGVLPMLALIVWYKWQPFRFDWPEAGLPAALAGTWRVPFHYQYFNTEFDAARQILGDVGGALALGMLLAGVTARLGRMAQLVAGLVAAAVVVAVEMGQVLLPLRVADPTTATLAALGAIGGAMLVVPLERTFIVTGDPDSEGATPWTST